jgi:hypothetical protein
VLNRFGYLAFSISEFIAVWITEDLIKYRDDIVKDVISIAYKYGFRNVNDQSQPHKSALETQQANSEYYNQTTTNDAFAHIWCKKVRCSRFMCFGFYLSQIPKIDIQIRS